MIRAAALLSLVATLALVLWVPSAYPPAHFVGLLRAEHARAAAFWGSLPAARRLDRALNLLESPSGPAPLARSPGLPGAVATEMAAANRRLFDSDYFRAVDALLLLAAYRAATLLDCLPVLAPILFAALADGALVRLIKAREFRQHDPEMFALYGSAVLLTLCGTLIAGLLPWVLPPWVLPAVPFAIGEFAGRALACFHKHG